MHKRLRFIVEVVLQERFCSEITTDAIGRTAPCIKKTISLPTLTTKVISLGVSNE
jgi:hypothetical protein